MLSVQKQISQPCRAMSRGRSFNTTPNQVIEGKYMNPKKLVRLLRNEYGQANFRVEVCFFTLCEGICPWLRYAA